MLLHGGLSWIWFDSPGNKTARAADGLATVSAVSLYDFISGLLPVLRELSWPSEHLRKPQRGDNCTYCDGPMDLLTKQLSFRRLQQRFKLWTRNQCRQTKKVPLLRVCFMMSSRAIVRQLNVHSLCLARSLHIWHRLPSGFPHLKRASNEHKNQHPFKIKKS